MRRTTLLYKHERSALRSRLALKVISYLAIVGGSGAIGFYAGSQVGLSSDLSSRERPITPSPRAPSPPQDSTCESLESALDQLGQERERLTLVKAQLKRARLELSEALKLSALQAQVTGASISTARLIHQPTQARHLPFLICLTDMGASDAIQARDLVAAQGVLLGEIIEPDPEREGCLRVLPVTSPRFSAEVQLAQTGVRGVAVGLGAQMGEELIDPAIRLKYLERSHPALIGEVAYLTASLSTSAERLSGERADLQTDQDVKSLTRTLSISPPLVVGEVISAQIRENGLFQEASLTSPLRRESVRWVSVISHPPRD